MLKAFLTALLLSLALAASSLFAQDEPPSRSITPDDFRSQRPPARDAGAAGQRSADAASSTVKKSSDVISSSKRKYSFVTRVSAARPAAAAAVAVKPTPPSRSTPTPSPVKTGASALRPEELGVTFWRLRP